ncbi:MAG: DEAD/DEAH box helicase, partial [Alphaproteobacteria bacterium]|nr:DEAD/DEAH box helicase [Alphaproteobacteria bacterium]
GRHMSVRATVIFGGVGQEPQVRSVARGIDIVVATPGRLLDLINQRHVRLDGVEAVVLDEADRMLDMGFIHDMRKIVRLLPAQRQTVMFSATMPPAIQELAQGILKNPKHVAVTPAATTVERIDQRVMFVEKSQKRALLLAVLQQQPDARAIVFTRTKHGADRVAEQLEKGGVNAAAIHGNKSQGQRQKALDSFRRGTLRILVATDIASRGIDVDGIGLIINFDLPHEPESYVHRIGRTARAGADGMAISFCDADEVADLRQIERTIRRAVPMDTSHPYHVQHAAPGRNAAPRQGRGRQGAGGHHAGHNGGNNNGGGHRQSQGKGRPGGGGRQGRGQRDGRPEGRPEGRQDGHRGSQHRGSQHRGGRGRVVSAGGAV